MQGKRGKKTSVTRPVPSIPTKPVDWQRVELWQQDYEADHLDRIRRNFVTAGIGSLDLVRSPEPAQLQGPANRFLLKYWREQGQDALPTIAAIDPIRMRPALGRILIVEPVEQGSDFRYRLFGSHIAGLTGFEMTGKLVSVHPGAPELVCFALALYRSLLARPDSVMTRVSPPIAPYACWERIVLPFVDAAGTVTRFVVGNVAFDREGRELRV
jgi:hypothetical protein